MGVTERLMLPEIDFDQIDRTRSMDITIVTTLPPTRGQGASRRLPLPVRSRPNHRNDLARDVTEAVKVHYEGGFVATDIDDVQGDRDPKFSTRKQNRCQRCGRPHSVYRSSVSAVSASASWRARAASWRPQGKLVGRRALASGAHAMSLGEPGRSFIMTKEKDRVSADAFQTC